MKAVNSVICLVIGWLSLRGTDIPVCHLDAVDIHVSYIVNRVSISKWQTEMSAPRKDNLVDTTLD